LETKKSFDDDTEHHCTETFGSAMWGILSGLLAQLKFVWSVVRMFEGCAFDELVIQVLCLLNWVIEWAGIGKETGRIKIVYRNLTEGLPSEDNHARHPQHTQTGSNSSTIAADSSNGVTNTRCCRYNCMRSWRWVEITPETCRAVSRYK
jgi:hypothetical protein